MLYQLSCSHVVVARDWPMPVTGCPHGQCEGIMRNVIAVEIRQHHAYCVSSGCRFGKWLGQDIATAKRETEKHALNRPGHTVCLDFMSFPDHLKHLRKYFPAKTKPYIIPFDPKAVITQLDPVNELEPPF